MPCFVFRAGFFRSRTNQNEETPKGAMVIEAIAVPISEPTFQQIS